MGQGTAQSPAEGPIGQDGTVQFPTRRRHAESRSTTRSRNVSWSRDLGPVITRATIGRTFLRTSPRAPRVWRGTAAPADFDRWTIIGPARSLRSKAFARAPW